MDTYEKKYNEALNWMRELYPGLHGATKEDAEHYFPELRESEDERIRKGLIDALKVSETIGELKFRLPYPTREECIAYLEKQKEQNGEDEECIDFTIYHPLKNGKGKYECIPYSFYGSLTSFSEGKDLIDFLRTCFYTKEECNEWIEKQKEQKPAEWSKDEKILDYLIEFIYRSDEDIFPERGGVSKLDILTYLEKQKEWKPIFKEGDMVIWDGEEFNILDVHKGAYNVGGYIVPFSRERELHPIGQKPAEWSEDDKKLIDDVINSLCCYQNTLSDYQKEIVGEEIRKLKSLKPQPKQEWSEEDETAFGDLMWCIEQARKSAKDENDMGNIWSAENWVKNRLKSLRPQPKQEWSEEDERILKGIIGKIDHDQTYGVSKAEMLSFLKSLRPVSKESLQPHWKPSEEQISSLKQARDYYMSGDIKYVGRHLSEIAEQLEKLM